jgi:hypothetical protein
MSEWTPRLRRLPGEVISGWAAPIAEKLDRSAGWDRLPLRLAIVSLMGIRQRLRARNLYDTRPARPPAAAGCETENLSEQRSGARTLDGRGNDPGDPAMGAAQSPFGRNAPPMIEDDGALYTPHALEVSERLLTRHEFFPAETLNLLAAAWVQFEVHDWFAHQTAEYDPTDLARLGTMPNVPADPRPLITNTDDERRYPAFVSDQTHWWDASQLYGAREDFAKDIREGADGKVKVDGELLKVMERYTATSGGTTAAVPNLWIGSALFHILFAKEHNAICGWLAKQHPTWDDKRLFQKARLINAAVMAKIHTVEWTPAIVAHPATIAGVKATWSGVLGGNHRRWVSRIGDEVLTGIPGSRLNHDGAPYALTEEFVAVYRLHQLIPDDVTFRRVSDDVELGNWSIEHLTVAQDEPMRPRDRLDDVEAMNAFYSLGTAHPGEITLHNHPQFLQQFKPIDAPLLNLGEVDILRTRQTGVPRYNNFRRVFRLQPASSFHQIANGNPKWAKEIRAVYKNELESVDLLIGMFAERKPSGFAFSDTAFRVFLLMAARRLRSDRFFTTDYTPEVYTPEGLKWIDDATLWGILQRQHPELFDAVSMTGNPFQPWRRKGS